MEFAGFPFEIKSLSDTGRIEGMISAFGGIDSYGDTIERGAYSKSLAQIEQSGRKLPVLYQHDPHRPIGVWSSLKQSETGLIGTAELAMEVPDAISAHALARIGALTGISIGYQIPKGGSRLNGNKRVLSEITLFEASLVTFPADPIARVTTIKSICGARDIAELLQEAGVSGRRAKAAAGAAWKAINSQDDEAGAEAELAQILTASTNRLIALGGQ